MSDEQQSHRSDFGESNGATLSERLIGWIFQPNLLLGASCLVAAAVFLPKTTRLLPDLRQDFQYRLLTSRIEITPPPHWVPHDLVEQIKKKAGLPDELSLLDKDITQRVAAAFERHPWVRGRVQVRTSVPARMRIDIEYREPVAMVCVTNGAKSGLFPIDAEATVLPSSDFSPAEVAKYPVIENVVSPPRVSAGMMWDDVRLQGAARLAVLLKPHWTEFGLKSIRVPARPEAKRDDLSYQLGTAGGSRIIWGRAPGSRHPGELTAEKKIERMKFYLRHHGPFDSTHGPCEFDITHWRDISRKQIAEKAATTRRR